MFFRIQVMTRVGSDRERCADYGISFDELEKCCRKLPNLSEEYIDSASHIMKAVASLSLYGPYGFDASAGTSSTD